MIKTHITFLKLVLVVLREIKRVISLEKIVLSDEEIIAFERYNALKLGTNDGTLQYKLRHFQSQKSQKWPI